MMVIKTMTLIDKGAELCKFYSMWKHNKLDSMREKMMKLPRANLADCESKDVSCFYMFVWVAVKFARAYKIARKHFCTKTLLHERSLFYEITFARADNFAREELKIFF